MTSFGRLLTAMVTPFDKDGNVDYKQARKLARALIDSGNDGLIVSGTTGESPTLTEEEKLRLFAETKEEIGDRGAVIAGTGSYSTRESIALTKEAEKMGVDGIMAVVPYYNKPTQEGLYLHFKAISESTPLPLIPYNVPTRTITNMSPETTVRISELKNVVGIKEASANLDQIAKIIQESRPDFLVYSGNDSDTFPILALGGYGVVSVAGHLVGKQIKKMIDLFLAGEIQESAQMHREMLPLVNSLFIVSNPIPIKFCLNEIGFNVGSPRLPLCEPDAKSAAVIRETLKVYTMDLPVG